jgi:ATP-binding cassette, subfamily C (CFTR/MRP), member 4
VMAELANIFAFRFLAAYDLHTAGLYEFFNGDDKTYWTAIGVLFGVYFLLSIVKFALLYVVILNSNKDIHAEMVNKIMRSPISYFDYTPSGQIINKFSNDIGIMDYVLAFNIVNSF